MKYPYGPFQELLMAGAHSLLPCPDDKHFEVLKDFHTSRQDWMVGHLAYDLKNQTERLSSSNRDHIGLEDMHFYIPEHIIHFDKQEVLIETYASPLHIIKVIHATQAPLEATEPKVTSLLPNFSREQYIESVQKLKEHIVEGDIYEINFCMAYASDDALLDPLQTYLRLTDISPTPFSVYHQFNDTYLLSASPERFLKKTGSKLISQPIKGTAKRGESPYEDEVIKQNLRTDEKELAENMMIVDLVRNDLAKSAVIGSVKVDEMFGIYTFRQLHQMISTVSAELRPEVHFIDAIKNAFPMGSMTGAPKVKVMELIEHYERARRNLYSGAMGYITPDGDFDFNVVIRSLLYNQATRQLSFQVGSAITYDAEPALEYDECLLKAKAIMQVLDLL